MNSDQSIADFTAFKNSLKNYKQLSNGDRNIMALVVVSINKRFLKEVLRVTVRLTTIEYGQISFDEGEIINSTIAHMDFSPRYQAYLYEHDGTLVIMGESNRLGKYEVKLTQI